MLVILLTRRPLHGKPSLNPDMANIFVLCAYCLHRCREIAARFLGERNGDSQHRIHAIGHCHIDSGELVELL